MEMFGSLKRDEEASRGDILRRKREGGGVGIEDLGYMGRGRIWRGYKGNSTRGPLRVEGWNDEIGGGKEPNFWKPIIDAPPSMRQRAAKLEPKEGCTPRRVGESGKLTAIDPGREAQNPC